MPSLQVKDFPTELYEELRSCATLNDRSISQQTVSILRAFLASQKQLEGANAVLQERQFPQQSKQNSAPFEFDGEDARQTRIAKRMRLFEKFNARAARSGADNLPSSVELVREMREERLDRLCPDLKGM